MAAIYKRELGSYFKSFIGYIFMAPLLVMGGIYTWANNFLNGSPQFEGVLYSLSFVLLFVIPVLTMRAFAEERRQRTDQLLYSLPVSMTRVVAGKYLAMITVLAVPLAILGVYPLILTAFGSLSLRTAYACLLAFYLLGCALIAVGEFLSSLTESQAVALVLSLLAMLLNYFLTPLASLVSGTAAASLGALLAAALLLGLVLWLLTRNVYASAALSLALIAAEVAVYLAKPALFEGLFGTVMGALCLFARFQNFANGIFSLTDIACFLAVIAVFLYLTVQSMEKRRWNG